MSQSLEAYLDQHQDHHLSALFECLRYPSVSTDPARSADVTACASHIAELMKTIGLDAVEILPTAGHPSVYAEWCHHPDRPTVLFYGHYDVQPEEPVEGWESPAFEPTIKDGQIIARGVSDDKGQVYCHLMALKAFLETTGELPVNVKVLIEGEEEVGSPHLPPLIESEKDRLAADVLLISDTPMYSADQPSLCLSLRGLVYFQVQLTTANTDLHSGQHGGAAPNAIQSLVELLSTLKDDQGRIQIPGFYDDILPLDPRIETALDQLAFDDAAYMRHYEFLALSGEVGQGTLSRRWYRPTCDLNGIWGGYMGEGTKTVIPAQAFAKLSCRLVQGQDPHKICNMMTQYLEKMCPDTAEISVTVYHGKGAAVGTDPSHPAVAAALQAIESVRGIQPVIQGEGGSIPVVEHFQSVLGLDPILMGLNLPDDKIHAPNEQFSLDNYFNGIKIAAQFYLNLSQQAVTDSNATND